jgi:group I intron endonuclease
MYVYKILNKITGEFYIGKTKHDINLRFKRHCYLACSGTVTHLYNAIRKYGQDNFSISLLEETDGKLLNEKEIYWIAKLNPTYNMTKGGDGGDMSNSESYWDYMKIRSELICGENNPFYGKKHTEETKLKISKSNKGRKLSDDAKKKISLKMTGRKMPKESVEKTREKNSKIWNLIDPNGNPITIKNLSEFCKNNGLDQRNMTKMYNGLQKKSKGYTRNV